MKFVNVVYANYLLQCANFIRVLHGNRTVDIHSTDSVRSNKTSVDATTYMRTIPDGVETYNGNTTISSRRIGSTKINNHARVGKKGNCFCRSNHSDKIIAIILSSLIFILFRKYVYFLS